MPVEHVLEAVAVNQARKPLYDVYRAYYAGRHELRFATPDWNRKYGSLVNGLRENLCPAVVSAYTDKLTIESWGDRAGDDEARDQGLTRLANRVHREVFRCGDAYTLTWPGGDGTPKARYHRADQIVPHVDPVDPDRLDWASKLWVDQASRHGRVNVYYPDRVERWRTVNRLVAGDNALPDSAASWMPHADDDGAAVVGHAFGAVPVCWWKRDDDDTGGYGTSALADVIPLQAALNKSLADMIVLSEAYSKPFWYLLNFRGSDAAQTNPLLYQQELSEAAAQLPTLSRTFDPTTQRIFTHDGPGPFGQLNPPDLTPLISVQREIEAKVARVVGIPAYYFTQTQGDVPSGESLRVLTSRLISAVRDFQQTATPVWRGQAQLLGMSDEASPRWADPMPMGDAERHEIALLKRDLGYPLADILRWLGEPDADGIADRAAAAQAVTAANLGSAFARGGVTGAGF